MKVVSAFVVSIHLFVAINKSGIKINVGACLINRECNNNKFWNPSNCECEYRKKAAYLTEECQEIIDNEAVSINNTITTTTTLDSCKPFVASSVLFLSVSVILTGIFTYFYFKSKSNTLPY